MKCLLLLPSNLIQQDLPKNPGERDPPSPKRAAPETSPSIWTDLSPQKEPACFLVPRKRWYCGWHFLSPKSAGFFTTYIPLIVLAFSGCFVCYLPPFMGARKQPLIMIATFLFQTLFFHEYHPDLWKTCKIAKQYINKTNKSQDLLSTSRTWQDEFRWEATKSFCTIQPTIHGRATFVGVVSNHATKAVSSVIGSDISAAAHLRLHRHLAVTWVDYVDTFKTNFS